MTHNELKALTKLAIFTKACARDKQAKCYERLCEQGYARHQKTKRPGWKCFKATPTGLKALRSAIARRSKDCSWP